jgi:hypothetical protein
MQVYTSNAATTAQQTSGGEVSRMEGLATRMDFSRITPRQLQAYCDELIFTGGDAEFDDAVALRS